MSQDNLGDRMKRYEDTFRQYLPNHLPVIIRIDGKAFHSLTKNADKPFDAHIEQLMDATALALCRQVQNVQVAYVQSDEISLLLHGYKKLTSQAWFDNNIQKMVSVAASIATAAFNWKAFELECMSGKFLRKFEGKLPAHFDARAYILPECEVNNYFIWRQQDASRNSISMLARSLYSHKELDGKNGKEMQELTFQKGRNWNDLPSKQRRGRCVRKMLSTQDGASYRPQWTIDNEIPVFTQDREYIEHFVGHKKEDNEQG